MKSKELQRPRPPLLPGGHRRCPCHRGPLCLQPLGTTPATAGPSPGTPAHLSLLPGEKRSAGPIQHLQKRPESPPHVDSRSSLAARLPWGLLPQGAHCGCCSQGCTQETGLSQGGLSWGDRGTPRQRGVFLTCCWQLQGGRGELAPVGPRRHGAGRSVLPAPCARQKLSNRIPLLLAHSPQVLS